MSDNYILTNLTKMRGELASESISKVRQNMKGLQGRVQNTEKSKISEKEALKSACDGFESLFLEHMMKVMRGTVPNDGLIKRGFAEDIYREMLDSQMSKEITGNGGIGLSSLIFRQLCDRMTQDGKE